MLIDSICWITVVDTDKYKVAAAFMAAVDVIQEAVRQSVNVIITHEPIWFNGMDRMDWVQEDPVYLIFW